MQETLFPGSPIPGSRRSPGEMTIHPSMLAWRIPWSEDPEELQSMGLQRDGHDFAGNTLYRERLE